MLFSAGRGTKEAENVFSHTAGGLMKSGCYRVVQVS